MAKAQGIVVRVMELPVRSLRVYTGFWAMACRAIAGLVRDPADFLDRVERRGLRVEKEINGRLRSLEVRSSDELRRAGKNALMPVRWVRQEVTEGSHMAEDEIERQVERVLERLGIPSRERLKRLSHEIETLSAKIDNELLRYPETERAAT